MDAWISFDFLKECFGAKSYSAIEMKRGSVNLLTRNNFDISTMRQKAAEWRNPEFYTRNVWFTDKDDDQALSLRFTGEVFYDVQSPFQRVRILESYKYGKMLALDDMVMTTEQDEFHYHEMISHPAMFTLENAKNIAEEGPDAEGLSQYRSVHGISLPGGEKVISNEEMLRLEKTKGNIKAAKELEVLESLENRILEIQHFEKNRPLTYAETQELEKLKGRLEFAHQMAEVPEGAIQVDVFTTNTSTGDFKKSSFYTKSEELAQSHMINKDK
jgi:hypothetical protein